MKKFWKDYWELWSSSFGFMKKHWLGTIIMNLVAMLAMFIYYVAINYTITINWNLICDKISAVFHKD